ncbi:hypothetical protein EAO06_29530 [Klebsiella pneumoniae]|nr:hypothetical protein EAO06_29530 [Klebsiella pneumoniae]RRE77993.1 hypothetical protein EAN97_20930 [Klebsiella pneumoniae]
MHTQIQATQRRWYDLSSVSYRKIAPVMITNFFSNDAWTDYDDLARTLMMAVDAIIEAEQETAE